MKYPIFFLILIMMTFWTGFSVALESEKAQATFAVH
jgi:hypothetical protein